MKSLIAIGLASVAGVSAPCAAGFSYVSSFATWQAFAPTFTTVDFTALQDDDWLTDQYFDLGVSFDGGLVQVSPGIYLQDGVGVYGGCSIEVVFAELQYAIGSHHPGSMAFDLYLGETLLYVSPDTGLGFDNFRGVTSTQPFDRVIMHRNLGGPSCVAVQVDNIYFSSVPTPGAAAVLLLGLAANARRRRENG